MKILYFGTVCDIKNYDRLLKDCSSKPSVATIVFESALLEGFKQNGADVEIHSFPMIPTYPASKLLRFGKNTEKLLCGYDCRWLNTLNLPVLKQYTRRRDAKKILKRWCKQNGSDGLVLTYSVPPFLVKDVIRYGKRYGTKIVAIVPDLLRDMYVNEKQGSLKTRLKNLYIKPALKLQGEYDGYVYLTDAMHLVVAPQKPYTVVEGIAAVSASGGEKAEKADVRAVMYAGMLHEKYGIMNLVDAFRSLDMQNAELWLFGDGTAVEQIKEIAIADGRIKYFGTVTREEILAYEKRATLLVNPRSPDEEFTAYSFPSKTIEYMLSGTPLLTTRLKGIPNEYFDYVFLSENNSVGELAQGIQTALSLGEDELYAFGARARDYIVKEKNAASQAAKILGFLEEVKGNA